MNILENKYLGKLCKRGHNWNETGKSLKYKSGGCCECVITRAEEYYYNNKTKIINKGKEYQKEYYHVHKDKIREYMKSYQKEYYKKCKAKKRQYYRSHKLQIMIQQKKYLLNRITTKESYQIHKEYQKKYHKMRMKTDARFKLNHNISKSIHNSINGNNNFQSWENLVGYSFKDLTKHLEKQFNLGMTWANYGKWHIDHIIPISVFNFDSPEHIDFKRCWALKNLQPLWAKENLRKHNKLDDAFQPSFKLKL